MRNLAILIACTVLACAQVPGAARAEEHDYLVELFDTLHDSPMQHKFDTIHPMPVGCVYVQRPGEDEDDWRWHFRTMKELGFTALKGLMVLPGVDETEVMSVALEEGIIPWWYGEGGWEPITGELLDNLGIPFNTPIADIRTHPKMLAHQNEVLRARILRSRDAPRASATASDEAGGHDLPDIGGIDLLDPSPYFPDAAAPHFVDWLRGQYGNVDALNHAWNQHHAGLTLSGGAFVSWDDVSDRWESISRSEYRHIRDIMRFRADVKLEGYRRRIVAHTAFDPNAPFRAGGEMGMFLPFSFYGVDMEGIAELMTDHGSFYPSIHLAWHYNEVDHEVTRPTYMMASLTSDYFKSGWTASWESTGGPQQFSGWKWGNGFTVDDGVMSQLMLSYLAGGFKGFGLWAWNCRTAGWEGGEYAILGRNNEITPRARRIGAIGQAARTYRDELWEAHKEPLVGVFVDWENEAYWGAMSVYGRDDFRQYPIRARAGVSRACINADVPFEYVTAADIRNGLALRYPVIYLPFALAVHEDITEALATYVVLGGRLVVDMPSWWFDSFGAITDTGTGSTFETLFGVALESYQYSGVNVQASVDDMPLEGFMIDMTPTTAEIVTTYDDGRPAVTENQLGAGSAVILGWEASLQCFKPGNDRAEETLLQYTLGSMESPYGCDGAIVYRLTAPEADHYFLINDGPSVTVTLNTGNYEYIAVIDAISGEQLDLGSPVDIGGYDGRWLRFEKGR
jgi:beta-galactosidase